VLFVEVLQPGLCSILGAMSDSVAGHGGPGHGEIYRRLMDAVDPALVDEVEQTLRGTAGVLEAGQVRLRWADHQLRAECEVIVAADASAIEAHQAAVDA
jgi:divalent metal cation (Fe/Co/Zn/Cd) transporter